MAKQPNSDLIRPLRSQPLRADEAKQAIRHAILAGTYPGGFRLIEDELAPILGVSKTPVREALRSLAQSGLVVLLPHRGAVVRLVDRELVRDVYGIRLLLEPEALRLSTPHQDCARLRKLRNLLTSARQAGMRRDYPRLNEANREFHLHLYELCGNPTLVDIIARLQDQVSLITVTAWGHRATWEDEGAQHDEILKAVESDDADLAADHLRVHIKSFMDRTLSELSASSVDGAAESPAATSRAKQTHPHQRRRIT